MFTWFARRAERKRNAHNLYGSIVTLSRAPALYTQLHVPDTLEGRFEILVLHVFMCLERLSSEQSPLSQEIVDMFIADMDTTSRELGVGDMAVPKKMRGIASVFEERIMDYKAAAASTDSKALTDALQKNIFSERAGAENKANGLSRYTRRLRKSLSAIPIDQLKAGRLAVAGIEGDAP